MTHPDQHHYDADEPVRGLPARLPEGERILWQGAPQWWSLARTCFRIQWIALYFAVMLTWDFYAAWSQGWTLHDTLVSVSRFGLLAGFVLGMVAFLSWAIAGTTVYTLTNRRLMIRAGVALPKSVNIPYRRVDGAALKLHANGTGNLEVIPNAEDRIAYFLIWPHLRGLHLNRAHPTLRAIPDAENVARILGAALAEDAQQNATIRHVAARPASRPVQTGGLPASA